MIMHCVCVCCAVPPPPPLAPRIKQEMFGVPVHGAGSGGAARGLQRHAAALSTCLMFCTESYLCL